MKCSKSEIHRKTHGIPDIHFEDQKLTSFAGLVLFQSLFSRLGLKQQLTRCFRHLGVSPIFGHGLVVLLLIVHLLIGYRRLQDLRYYQDDPMVLRLLGISRLPDVATVSRTLAGMDARSVDNLRQLNRQLVLDMWHRPGNVHDSNGAKAFIEDCIREIRTILPQCTIEVRMDAAFFSDAIVSMLESERVEFTISVPFERFVALKAVVEGRKRWRHLNSQWSFFEAQWKPKSWDRRHRFVCIRQRNRKQHKEPVQLNLFIPYEYGYDFKVIITNKQLSAKKVLTYHNGRGAQEGLFAELKSQTQMDYVPTRNRAGNQVYLISAMLAHNLNREMQMRSTQKERGTTERRMPLWRFEQLGTLRRKLIQRAGRLTKPQGKLTLTMSANAATKSELLHYLDRLKHAA